MRTCRYFFGEYGDREYEYDPTPEDQVNAIVDFWMATYFQDVELSDEVMLGLKALANDARYEMDYDDVIEEYCEDIAREEYLSA